MAEERELVGIGIPFVAGVAVGAVLCPFHSEGLPLITDLILLLLICITTLAVRFGTSTSSVTERFRNRNGKLGGRKGELTKERITFAGIFMVAGIFCSLNYSMASGIPEYDSGLISLAAEKAVGHLRRVIDSILYPS